jgi:hypothetical protein
VSDIQELLYTIIEILNEINDKLPAPTTTTWYKYPEPTENEHD